MSRAGCDVADPNQLFMFLQRVAQQISCHQASRSCVKGGFYRDGLVRLDHLLCLCCLPFSLMLSASYFDAQYGYD